MEKKRNKGKLEIIKFSRKSAESRNCALHVELISAMKTVQDPTVFMKTQK